MAQHEVEEEADALPPASEPQSQVAAQDAATTLDAHFGFNAPPFRLSSDPRFYFASKGQRNAMAYLKYGLIEKEGFVVITGDVGAGKTTLLARMLQRLDPDRVVSAQITNTQLDPTELLDAICLAFGVPDPGRSKSRQIAALEAFMTALAIGGRRALLVVDEAQNLGRLELEELRMLSNFQLGSQALLQSFLVGQPELRPLLASPELAQMRQRVIASFHLGPLAEDETRQYIEHRLRMAGWSGEPLFEGAAYARVHAAAGGIPRRINVLCGRLLISASMEHRHRIDADEVDAVAASILAETGVDAGAAGTLD